jgi:hypothetical protein
MARRHLSLSEGEWDALPWTVQRSYWDGMVTEGLIRVDEAPLSEGLPQIAARQAEAGADVIDIRSLIADSQAAQRAANG